MKNSFKVIFVIIGAFIGAGFASGREIYTFFCIYGKKGVIGLCISTFIFSLVVYKSLSIIKENNIENYKDFLNIIIKNNNKYLKQILNNVINVLMLISFFIMIAGFGAYFNQEYGINNYLGSGILAFISYLILRKKNNSFIRISQILVPIMIFSIFLIGIMLVNKNLSLTVENRIEKDFIKN